MLQHPLQVGAAPGGASSDQARAKQHGFVHSYPQGGPGGRTVHCARAVRKVDYFGPIFPDGQGHRSNYCVPIDRNAQIGTQSKKLR